MAADFNKKQREAIEHVSGPLLIIAGAGTGKTSVLTGRFLYLIQQQGFSPESLLALTFSEKAAQEMLERVELQLPIGHPELFIKTFHAFCDQVLRERGHEIGLPLDYRILREADLWLFLKRHLVDLKLDYYRPLGNPQKFLRAIQQHFSRLQDEDIAPQKYEAFAEQKLKTANDEPQREFAAKHRELARVYATYQRLLLENNSLDFGGLLFFTLRLFEQRPSVLAEYQQRFRAIMVDEFQDTNFSQNRLVTLLAAQHKNLLVVGDDDQSIYKWRGASLTNIEYFQKLFPEAEKIVLNENYRSHQAILDLAYRVIQKNNPRRLEVAHGVDKRLIAVGRHKTLLPSVYHFSSLDEEVDFVLSRAGKVLQQGQSAALLVRSNALAAPFVEKMKFSKIPYQHVSSSAVFTKPAVKDCLALLKVVADPADDQALFRLVSMPFWKISMKEILALLREARRKNAPLFDLFSHPRFSAIKTLLDDLIEHSRNRPVSALLKEFFAASGYLAALQEKNHGEGLADLAAFSEKVREFEQAHPGHAARDFLEFIAMVEETGDRSAAETLSDPRALKILTIHSAKGLEFDAVFVPGLAQGKFPSVGRKDPFEIPAELIAQALPEGDHHVEEERRLFYVAATRAKNELVFSYSDFYDGKRAWKPSIFIAEALESGKAAPAHSGKSRRKKQQDALPLDQRPHRPVKLMLPKLSYSQIETFRTCPLKYQFRYLFQIAVPMPAVVNFGSSIHNTLRDFYLFLQKKPDGWNGDSRPQLKACYEKNWIAAGYETRALQEDQKKRGLSMLERFYAREREQKRILAFLEKPFKLTIGSLSISGRIDRIDRLPDGTYEVIDYKTGSAEKNLEKDLQLSLYALACRDVLKIPVSKLSLYFLGELEKVSTSRTDSQLDACREEMIECAREIAGSDFTPTPGYHCRYCDYRLLCPVAAPINA